ncbi:DUF4126 domain-containing protein [Thermoleptolyngbya oregonensis NK1-22]|jgi:hypothetical protein|uniref:DUF4126 domain-containing protein n=1 Tax=Thermoleptolyngbya oregonensis NK1-22 TaxID=2547457 RepID=A0AA96Y7H0_9CYAN|nr:DUF4126 domain-containing protein [Thermoleptolyngbya sp. M55_K2018_002]WOB45074.1 DUF4126 domain-containing protein [Thermoleptolyngbya oregonensis NK1-22]HIK39171.1 DUF4126 domain-containing protein [Thermoleptolyngbya sp. M55_K2018_002]
MDWNLIIDLCIGIGLSAAAGFRLLVPFLVLSMAALFGHFPVAPDLQWVDSFPALLTLGVAVLVEVIAYFVPWLDTLLDLVAFPASIIAGTLLTAAFSSGLDPFLRWSLAILAGGGAAGAMRGLSGFSRQLTTIFTGGLANFLITSLEILIAVVLSVLAIALPGAAIGFLLGLLGLLGRLWLRVRTGLLGQPVAESPAPAADAPPPPSPPV